MPGVDPVLLDTHVLLWWQARSDRLSRRARSRLADAATLLISPITCWEVGMLVARGTVSLDRPTAAWVRDVLAHDRVQVADLTAGTAVTASELGDFHGDPADRLLYATARHHRVALLTKDRLIRSYARTDPTVLVVW